MAYNEGKIAGVAALKALAQKLHTETPTKVSDLTNDAGYQTGEQVETAITAKGYQTGTQVESAINAKVSSTYRAGGSVAFASLPELTEANCGLVVNVTDAFTTTASFVEGAGKKHPAGTNVAVVQSGDTYQYDVLAGFVDLSGLVEKEEGKVLSSNDYTNEEKAKLASFELATDAEVTEMLNEVFGTSEA